MGHAVGRPFQAVILALGCSACLQLNWERKHIDFKASDERIHALQPGNATMGDALASLGAPLLVWELPAGGVAIAYGGYAEEELGLKLSVPVAERASADFDYNAVAAKVEGHALFFDAQGRLVVVAEGLLRDLRSETERRPADIE